MYVYVCIYSTERLNGFCLLFGFLQTGRFFDLICSGETLLIFFFIFYILPLRRSSFATNFTANLPRVLFAVTCRTNRRRSPWNSVGVRCVNAIRGSNNITRDVVKHKREVYIIARCGNSLYSCGATTTVDYRRVFHHFFRRNPTPAGMLHYSVGIAAREKRRGSPLQSIVRPFVFGHRSLRHRGISIIKRSDRKHFDFWNIFSARNLLTA